MPSNEPILGLFHTHPDSFNANGQESSVSAGDAVSMVDEQDLVVIAQSGPAQFMFMRTGTTPGAAAQSEYEAAVQSEETDVLYKVAVEDKPAGQATRELAIEVAQKFNLAYYEGRNGVLQRVWPPP